MPKIISCLLLALVLGAVCPPAAAQQRAYAPENLRSLSYTDQVRVISLEYSEQSGGRRIPDDQLRFYTDQVNRSNWRFSQIKADIARSLAGSGGVRPPDRDVIRCDSNDNKSRNCDTPWRGRSRLVRKVSNSPCEEGRQWSSQAGRVTVWSGCRAEFAAAQVQPTPGHDRTVRCESVDNRARSCDTPWRDRSRLIRQLSSTACIEGRNWSSRAGQVQVSNGCRGEFASVRQASNRPPWTGPYSVTCSSTAGKLSTCAWDWTRGQPRLIQQLSRQPCREGTSWGHANNRGIWVTAGCSARFGVR